MAIEINELEREIPELATRLDCYMRSHPRPLGRLCRLFCRFKAGIPWDRGRLR